MAATSRWLVFSLVVLACHAPSGPRRDRMGRVVPKLVPSPADSAAEELPVPRSADDDPELNRFLEQLAAACKVKPSTGRTWELVERSRRLGKCAERYIERDLASLPEAERRVLGAALPRRTKRRDYQGLNRFVDVACKVDDLLMWTSNGTGDFGTFRHNTYADCLMRGSIETSYLVEAYAHRDAARAARHLQFASDAGRRAQRMHDAMAQNVERLAPDAPEGSPPNDFCVRCVLNDADYRYQRRLLAALHVEVPRLAQRLCGAWPELVRELHGDAACLAAASLYWSSLAADTQAPEPVQPESPASDAAQEPRWWPPSKDQSYAAFVEPLLVGCEPGPDADDLREEVDGKCLERARRRQLESFSTRERALALRREGAWHRFVGELSRVEAMTNESAYSHSQWDDGERLQTRDAFLLHAWASDDVAAFRAHVEHRRAWGQRVRQGLAIFDDIATTKCRGGEPYPPRCHDDIFAEELWGRAARSAKGLPSQAADLSRQQCGAWPALASSFSGQCEAALTDYFLSHAVSLGGMLLADP